MAASGKHLINKLRWRRPTAAKRLSQATEESGQPVCEAWREKPREN